MGGKSPHTVCGDFSKARDRERRDGQEGKREGRRDRTHVWTKLERQKTAREHTQTWTTTKHKEL